jgi:peptidoglycan biosynthesis protein MviN/MurJ (putative lipid II flippase)
MVAIIPPGVPVACDSRFDGLDKDAIKAKQHEISELVKPGLLNNLIAYFGIALLAIVLLAIFARHFTTRADRVKPMRKALIIYAVVVLTWAIGAYQLWLNKASWAHMLSAVFMFAGFAVVIIHNGWRRAKVPPWYRIWSRRTLFGMLAATVVWGSLVKGPLEVRWAVFALEMSLLLLFGAFWVMQTAAFWERDVVTGTDVTVSTPGSSEQSQRGQGRAGLDSQTRLD